MKVNLPYKVQAELVREYRDAERMHSAILLDSRRKIDQPCEKLHYWDGKRSGLRLALEAMGVEV